MEVVDVSSPQEGGSAAQAVMDLFGEVLIVQSGNLNNSHPSLEAASSDPEVVTSDEGASAEANDNQSTDQAGVAICTKSSTEPPDVVEDTEAGAANNPPAPIEALQVMIADNSAISGPTDVKMEADVLGTYFRIYV